VWQSYSLHLSHEKEMCSYRTADKVVVLLIFYFRQPINIMPITQENKRTKNNPVRSIIFIGVCIQIDKNFTAFSITIEVLWQANIINNKLMLAPYPVHMFIMPATNKIHFQPATLLEKKMQIIVYTTLIKTTNVIRIITLKAKSSQIII
jgi:hypothetical protein